MDGNSSYNPADGSNWQTLCVPCHSTKTAREDGGFGNVRR
nr:HNH endonuclease [Stenotrophomonas geniculata]